jgi:hypothetical protein
VEGATQACELGLRAQDEVAVPDAHDLEPLGAQPLVARVVVCLVERSVVPRPVDLQDDPVPAVQEVDRSDQVGVP